MMARQPCIFYCFIGVADPKDSGFVNGQVGDTTFQIRQIHLPFVTSMLQNFQGNIFTSCCVGIEPGGGLMFSVMKTRLVALSCSRSQELSKFPAEIENNGAFPKCFH